MLLKEPIKIKNLELANRLVLPPMHTGKCPEGKVSPELCEYYVRRAADGAVGLIITEFSYVSLQGRAISMQLSLAEDSDIPGHKTLVDLIHAAGSKVFSQINHAGAAAQGEVTGCEVVAPQRGPLASGEGGHSPAPTADSGGDCPDRGGLRLCRHTLQSGRL